MARCDKCGYEFQQRFIGQSFCYSCFMEEKKVTKLTKLSKSTTPMAKLLQSLRAAGHRVDSSSKPIVVLRALCDTKGIVMGRIGKKRANETLRKYLSTNVLQLPSTATRVRAGKSKIDFFSTPEWRKLRYQVLEKYGRRCMCCGRSPKDGITLHVDHIKPRSKFPTLELNMNNLQVLCEDCNIGKGAWDQTDFRPALVVA